MNNNMPFVIDYSYYDDWMHDRALMKVILKFIPSGESIFIEKKEFVFQPENELLCNQVGFYKDIETIWTNDFQDLSNLISSNIKIFNIDNRIFYVNNVDIKYNKHTMRYDVFFNNSPSILNNLNEEFFHSIYDGYLSGVFK